MSWPLAALCKMLAISILIGITHICSAQNLTTACAESETIAATSRHFGVAEAPLIPVTGAFRALIVFVQYLDDTGTNQPGCGPEDWPLGSTANPTMPVIGARILEPSVGSLVGTSQLIYRVPEGGAPRTRLFFGNRGPLVDSDDRGTMSLAPTAPNTQWSGGLRAFGAFPAVAGPWGSGPSVRPSRAPARRLVPVGPRRLG